MSRDALTYFELANPSNSSVRSWIANQDTRQMCADHFRTRLSIELTSQEITECIALYGLWRIRRGLPCRACGIFRDISLAKINEIAQIVYVSRSVSAEGKLARYNTTIDW